jgi:hypothetical protein
VVDANGQPLGYFYSRDDDTDRKVYPLTRRRSSADGGELRPVARAAGIREKRAHL